MIELTINNKLVSVPEGTTILKAAEQLGIEIPIMCYLNGYPHNTSCMICAVEDKQNGKLIPSCSAPVVEGMQIETENERVNSFRKDTLDLLLSEHVGDCEAPCVRTCPAFMDIPKMIRQIQQKDWKSAIRTVKNDIPLPSVLGRICPAPCEKGCKRNQYDSPVSICLLKRIVGDKDLESGSPYMPECEQDSGKSVAIIGAGPAGLSAAYYLRQMGHAVTVFDKNEQPGGNLYYAIPDEKLDKTVLKKEIELIQKVGVQFELGMSFGTDFSFPELKSKFDAIILATGEIESGLFTGTNLEHSAKGLKVNRKILATNIEGVFAGGSLVSQSQMAVRSVGQGKIMALSVDQYLSGKHVIGRSQRFNSLLGRIKTGEEKEFLKEARDIQQIEAGKGVKAGYTEEESVEEAFRCFHCDCRKQDSCKLRNYSEEYAADQNKFRISQRNPFEREVQHDLVVFESGKCIKCGLCVQITEKSAEKFGLTFINRGFNVKIAIPFNEALDKGLAQVAKECAEACPTAAIALK